MAVTSTDVVLATRRSTHVLLSSLSNGRPSLAYEALLDITGEFRQYDKNRDVRFSTLLDDTMIEMTMSGRAEEAQLLRNLCDSVTSIYSDHSILMLLLMCARAIRKKRQALPPSFFSLHTTLSHHPQPIASDAWSIKELHTVPDIFHEPQSVVDMHHTDRNGSLTLRPLSSKDRFDCIADAARFTLEQRSLWALKKSAPSRSTKGEQDPLFKIQFSAQEMLDFVRIEYDNFHRTFKPLPVANIPFPPENFPSSRDTELLHLVLSHCISGPDSDDMPTSSPGTESRPTLVRAYLHQVEDVHPDARRAHIYRRMYIRRRQQVMRLRQSHPESSSDFVTGIMTRASRCGAIYCDVASFTECYFNATRHRILRAVADFSFKVSHNYFQMLFAVTADKSILVSNKPYAVVQAAESFISDGTVLADILEHVEDTDGSSVAIMNLLMVEATEHPFNEMVQLLFCTSISAYFNSIWDWFFEGSVRRDTYADFFGTMLGLSPEGSELLENTRTCNARNQNSTGLYPDLFSKEEALFLLRAGRSRKLLCSFGGNQDVLAKRPDDIEFENNAVCFDDVERVLNDLADSVNASFAADGTVSTAHLRGLTFAKNCDSDSVANMHFSFSRNISDSERAEGESFKDATKYIHSTDDSLGVEEDVNKKTLTESGGQFADGALYQSLKEQNACTRASSLESITDFGGVSTCGTTKYVTPSHETVPVENAHEDAQHSREETRTTCKTLSDDVVCAHNDEGRDINGPMLSPACVRCTAFQVPDVSWSSPSMSTAEVVSLFSMVVGREPSKAEDALQNVMPSTRRKARFPLPAMLSTQLLVPLRRIDSVIQKVVLRYFISHLRLFDHLWTLRAHVLLGAGDFANELVVQLDAASLIADANERVIHRRAAAAMSSYESDSAEGRYTRNQAQLNLCLRTALNLYSIEANPLADLIHLDSDSDSIEHSEGDRRSSSGHSQFWQDRIIVRYDVTHPLNVIITEEAMGKYSQIFELFLRILRARKSLRSLYLASRRTRAWGKALRQNREFAKKIWMFCWLAEHFVSIFGGFEMEQVLGSCWTEFEKGWPTAKSIWELRDSHKSFLDGCIRRCLLGEKHRSVLKVMTGGFEIVVNVDREISKLGLADAVSGSTEINNVMDLLTSATASLKRRCAFLTDVLERLLEGGTLPHLEHLLTQLNYNYYFQRESPMGGATGQPDHRSTSAASQLWQTS